MGMAKEAHAAKQRKSASKGIGRYGLTERIASDHGVTWDEVDSLILMRFIHAVTEAGDACTFGRTSDGGALSLTLLAGVERTKLYFKDADEANERLAQLTVLATS